MSMFLYNVADAGQSRRCAMTMAQHLPQQQTYQAFYRQKNNYGITALFNTGENYSWCTLIC